MTEAEIVILQKRLDELSGQLNLRIEQEETYLKVLGLGVETFIKTADETALGYSNVLGEWSLIVKRYDGNGDVREWPLLRAPRGLRLHCIKHFFELREAILQNALSLADRIEQLMRDDSRKENQ